MEHYFKGENVEHEEVLDEELKRVLPENHAWIRVKPGSKINNLIGPASAALKDNNGIVLISGSGPALTKVVSCAEVVKRRCKASYQATKLCSRLVEEHWQPTRDDLEPLKVTREIPNLQIALSKEPFETGTRQTRNYIESFLNFESNKNKSASRPKGNKNSKGTNQEWKTNSAQSAAQQLGLQKPKRTKNRNGGGKNAESKSSDIKQISEENKPADASKSPQQSPKGV